MGNRGTKLPILKGEKHRIKNRDVKGPVASWKTKLRMEWEDSHTGGRLPCWTDMREEPGLAQAEPCEMPPLSCKASLCCSQNHTNITPGFAVLGRNLPRLLLAKKCIPCEIKANTSLSWYLKSVIGHILLGKSCTLIDVALAGQMQHGNAAFLYSKRNPEKALAKLWKALSAPQASVEAWLWYTVI